MPRLTTQPPAYRLHKSTGQAIVSFQGKKFYLGPHGSKQSRDRYEMVVQQWREHVAELEEKRAKELERQRQKRLREQTPTPTELRKRAKSGGRVFILELAYCYVEHAKSYYRKNGQMTREAEMIREVCLFLLEYHEVTPVTEFGPVALDELRDLMITERDWSRRFINKQCSRIIRMFRWGTAKEIVPPNIPNSLKSLAGLKKGRTIARETPAVLPVDDAVVTATLLHLTSIVRDMVLFQRVTTCRPGEVCSIRPCDVDRTGEVWKYVPKSHKVEHHDRQRVIFIGPKGQVVLRRYLLRDSEAYCFSPAESTQEMRDARAESRTTPLSCGNRERTNRKSQAKREPGLCYDVNSYRRAIHRACDAAFPAPGGVDVKVWNKQHRWHPNQLRHSAASEIRKEFGLEASQAVLGHASADITQIYAERDQRLAASVASKLG